MTKDVFYSSYWWYLQCSLSYLIKELPNWVLCLSLCRKWNSWKTVNSALIFSDMMSKLCKMQIVVFTFRIVFFFICTIWHFTSNQHTSSLIQKYQPFPLLSYFSVVVCLRCLYQHILSASSYRSWESWGFASITLCNLQCVQIIEYFMAWRWCWFVCTLRYLIIIMRIYRKEWNLHKMLVKLIMLSVCLRLKWLSKLQ